MSVGKLARQLRREVVTRPKKAAVLGLMVLVALWFWVPLIRGWVAGDDGSPMSPAAPAAAQASSAPSGTGEQPSDAKADGAAAAEYSWLELVDWMENDARTSVASLDLQWCNPFEMPGTNQPVGASAGGGESASGDAPAELKVEDFGLALSGTAVGPRRRVARINGRSYHQGGTVTLIKDGQQIDLTLAEVHPKRIVLDWNGTQFELNIPPPAYSSQILGLGGTQ